METFLELDDTTTPGPTSDGVENELFIDNSSFVWTNSTVEAEPPTWYSMALMGLLTILLIFIILATIIGNALVIAAVCMERNLQNVANRLIVSLSVADLMVAVFVMPFAAHYMIIGSWQFGWIFCDLWTSADVLCCSASILHLVGIGADRYLAVSRINWTVNRNKTHINLMILLVWLVACMVSVAPLLGWKDPHYWSRIEDNRCMVSPDVGYQVFATVSTFYAPTFLILFLYWKIWQTAKSRIRHRVGKANNHNPSTSAVEASKMVVSRSTFSADELSCQTGTVESSESVVGSPEEQEMEQLPISTISGGDEESGINPSAGLPHSQITLRPPPPSFRTSQTSLSAPDAPDISAPTNSNTRMTNLKKKKESLEAKRERKAAKTLAVITGVFLCCWFPFFLMVLWACLCKKCTIPEYVANGLQWLGYLNSTINPMIYTVFNPEFRKAITKVIITYFWRKPSGGQP